MANSPMEQIRNLTSNPVTSSSDLLEFILNQDPQVRVAAFQALWNFPSEEALDAGLSALSSDPENTVRLAAVAFLGRYVWAGAQMDAVWGAPDAEIGNITEDQTKRVSATLGTLMRELPIESDIRGEILLSLCYDAKSAVIKDIENLWNSDSMILKRQALRCMGRAANARFSQLVVDTIGRGDPDLLPAAIEAAGDGCFDAAEKALLELAHGQDRSLALASIWALRNVIHTTLGRRQLERIKRGRDADMAKMARAALEEIDALDLPDRPDDSDDD